jgi:uncharacterized protein YidB (DUF937 family)
MGLVDQLMSAFKGGDMSKLMGSVEGILGQSGGISKLVERFDAAGLGDKAKSWISTGDNEPVSGAEVKSALPDQVSKIAQETGKSEDEIAEGLAKVLPKAVDDVTPDGAIPDEAQLQERLASIR